MCYQVYRFILTGIVLGLTVYATTACDTFAPDSTNVSASAKVQDVGITQVANTATVSLFSDPVLLDTEIARLIQSLGQDKEHDDRVYAQLQLLIDQRNLLMTSSKNTLSGLFLQQNIWQGDLEVIVVDRINNKGEVDSSSNVFYLNTQQETVQLFFLNTLPADVEMIRQLRVFGIKSKDRILVERLIQKHNQ